MQTKSFSQIMSDGTEIWINRWAPDSDDQIKGVIQLHHGIQEHSMRYDRLGSVLADAGYVLNAYDMRGHGHTAELAIEAKKGMFGKIADKDGFDRIVCDLYEITNAVKLVYPGKKLILLTHSFGSFVGQAFIERFGNKIDGCILIGTAGPRNLLIKIGQILSHTIKTIKGSDYVSKLLYKLAMGNYNRKIKNPKDNFSWLSVNELNVDIFNMDNWCGIPLTNSILCDLTDGLVNIHSHSNMKKIPNELPIYILYGKEDPVGNYGKTVNKLFNIYKKNGIKNLQIKEYQNVRHEILNEDIKETVENDIINWISKI